MARLRVEIQGVDILEFRNVLPTYHGTVVPSRLDGTKVTMYAQRRSAADYQAMRENPAPLPYPQQALAIAKFEPGMYEVVEIYSGTSSEH
jgi:hypothetical protein